MGTLVRAILAIQLVAAESCQKENGFSMIFESLSNTKTARQPVFNARYDLMSRKTQLRLHRFSGKTVKLSVWKENSVCFFTKCDELRSGRRVRWLLEAEKRHKMQKDLLYRRQIKEKWLLWKVKEAEWKYSAAWPSFKGVFEELDSDLGSRWRKLSRALLRSTEKRWSSSNFPKNDEEKTAFRNFKQGTHRRP